MTRCPACGRPKALDLFAGEGGAGVGYQRAGFCVDAVDKVPARKTPRGQRARLANYPLACPAAQAVCADAVHYAWMHGREYALVHASPTCTGYSRGTAAIPDRLDRYDRLIGVMRDVLVDLGVPYIIENVEDAGSELVEPVLLCWTMFNAPGSVLDDDGTPLQMKRHRLFESNLPLTTPPHPVLAPGTPHPCMHPAIQVAGSYGGARRDPWEAKHIRKGGYVPAAVDVQRELLGTPWMTEKGCQLSIPPDYTEHLGAQVLAQLEVAA